ncbi:MAG: hypothetical protein AAF598_19565, partial [Bacteroidota bacterium]
STNYSDLSKQGQEKFDACEWHNRETYWDVIELGASWYNGGGLDTQSTTSHLPIYKNITYHGSNAHDLSFETAWVEGVKGHGIGEKITYHFPAENPRITEIKIANGYIKSEIAWRNNSRVKQLKMYLNGELYAFLNLADSRQLQTFKVEPIGHGDREDYEKLCSLPEWTMTFEITAVYPGEKYEDTAITEIFFDGIDVN